MSDKALRWLIAGGGTGGHVTPALALGEIIAERGEEVLFLGADRGLETRLVPAAGFRLVTLPSSQFMGKSWLGKVRALFELIRAAFRAAPILHEFQPDIVISVGGYAAVPAVLAAKLQGIPLAIVEPNARPGRTNRISKWFATRIFVGFDAAIHSMKRLGSSKHIRVFGIPLRKNLIESFLEHSAAARRDPEPPYRLLVFGGSQGSRQINELLMDTLQSLSALPLEIFHQTGGSDFDRVKKVYANANMTTHIVPFETNMPERYQWADLAICRAGALTVAELSMAGLPAIFIPYPHAADDHQTANAQELVAAGAARCLDATAATGSLLAQTITELLTDRETLRTMNKNASGRARPDAAHEIIAECVRVVRA